jgi:predicted dienelactone hydrolase
MMEQASERKRLPAVFAALLAVAISAVLWASPAVEAQSNPYQRGPDPTRSALTADGPFSVTTYTVSRFAVTGFGGGVIYYPTGTSLTFGGIAVSPGYTADASSLAWFGRRLASHGFVVLVINTNSRYDFPDSRASQLAAALDYLVSRSPSAVRARLDTSRLAVAGHSMGGGATLRISENRPSLKAAVPLTPWHTDKTFNTSVPQLIIGAEADTVAPVSEHAIPFYQNLPSTTPKVYLELNNASHFAPNTTNASISIYAISWMKLWVDNDTRYRQFLCNISDPALSDVRTNNLHCQ